MNINEYILESSSFKNELESSYHVLKELVPIYPEPNFIYDVNFYNNHGTIMKTNIKPGYYDYQIVHEILLNVNGYHYYYNSIQELKDFILHLFNNNILEWWNKNELFEVIERRAGNERMLNISHMMRENILTDLVDDDIFYYNKDMFNLAYEYLEVECNNTDQEYQQFIEYYKQFKEYYRINIPLSDDYILECFYYD